MKKVVVVYPCRSERCNVPIGTACMTDQNHIYVSVSEKTFECKADEEYLEVINKPDGCLVITCNAQIPKYKPFTMAVFKHWIYWEPIK